MPSFTPSSKAKEYILVDAVSSSPIRYAPKLGALDVPSVGSLNRILNAPAEATSQPDYVLLSKTMRDNFGKALDLTRVLPEPKTESHQLLPGMGVISECHCKLFDRVGEHNTRVVLENAIVDAAKKVKEKGIKPHIVAMGSGFVGQEVYVLRQLNKAGIKDIKLDLVDIYYENIDPKSEQTKGDVSLKQHIRKYLADEIVTVLSMAFNGKFKLVETETSECSKFYSLVKQQLPKVDNQPDNHLEVRIFKDSAAYLKEYSAVKKEKKKNTPRPNIIYDIDFIDEKARAKEINRVTDTMGVGAHRISANLSSDESKVQLLHKVKEAKGWSVSLDRTFS